MRIYIIAIALFSNVLLAGELQNNRLTPGLARQLTLAEVCSTRWGVDRRLVTKRMKDGVYAAYGRKNHVGVCAVSPRGCEIDHLIPRSLAGADHPKNLWPEPFGGELGAEKKDKLENKLHSMVCAAKPTMTLKQAQTCIATDWIKCYYKVKP